MKIDDARTFQSRLLFRISHEPTQSARTLRAVIRGHRPDSHDPDSDVICMECNTGTGQAAPYPCATMQTVALELQVPIPDDPTYRSLIDG